jgi:hypothetical protein
MGSTEDVDIENLRRRVVDLAHATLHQLEIDLVRGSVAQRNAAIKTVAPYLLRILSANNEEDQQADLKQAVTDLMSEMRGT